MPKLTNSERKSIDERMAVHERIRATFEGRYYVYQTCYLCYWASNGRTLDEAVAANQEHISATHPSEEALMRETEVSLSEFRGIIHDHDCQMAVCSCIHGCSVGPFCQNLGPLCSTCVVRDGRGDKEHGEP